jgi:hypothetical protein
MREGVVTSSGVVWQAGNQSKWPASVSAGLLSWVVQLAKESTPSGFAGATAANIGTSSAPASPGNATSLADAFASRVSPQQIDLNNLLATRLDPARIVA